MIDVGALQGDVGFNSLHVRAKENAQQAGEVDKAIGERRTANQDVAIRTGVNDGLVGLCPHALDCMGLVDGNTAEQPRAFVDVLAIISEVIRIKPLVLFILPLRPVVFGLRICLYLCLVLCDRTVSPRANRSDVDNPFCSRI